MIHKYLVSRNPSVSMELLIFYFIFSYSISKVNSFSAYDCSDELALGKSFIIFKYYDYFMSKEP